MPRYDYRCHECGSVYELALTGATIVENGKEIEIICPVCREVMERLPSAPNFSIKGFSAKNGYSES